MVLVARVEIPAVDLMRIVKGKVGVEIEMISEGELRISN